MTEHLVNTHLMIQNFMSIKEVIMINSLCSFHSYQSLPSVAAIEVDYVNFFRFSILLVISLLSKFLAQDNDFPAF